ncbi:MAG: hypothetical protein LKF42_04235 [Streptococcaceae bacterium]|jgi:hypothetical protein|nr:hypothetical protein [Streptococcaceae bacterium]MCH4178189.1 hypothetical protein [Streptococcaceae bacterium]
MKNNQKYYNTDKQLEMASLIICELLNELKEPSKRTLRELIKEYHEHQNNLSNEDYSLNLLILKCAYFISEYKIQLTTRESLLLKQLNEILYDSNK